MPSSIFNHSNNCSGGSSITDGKPGALRLYYTYPPIKCEYHLATNGGGGGGAGQIWIGEIDVVPGQKINFNIGVGGDGGNKDANIGYNGKDGGCTSIVVDGYVYGVSGGKGGKYESDDTYIENSGGLGGGIKTSNFSNSARYVNWIGTSINTSFAGKRGEQGYLYTDTQNGAGGSGGATYKFDRTSGLVLKPIDGGNGGGVQSNGIDSLSSNYGTGGGGGGASPNGSFGTGGKGANGYIYVEWGNSNGGGGAAGQVVVKKNVWVSAGTKIKINVGKGGEARPIVNMINGVSGYFGEQGNNGGDSFITTSEGEAIRAKGGIGGYPGTSVHGKGGNSEGSVSSSGTSSDLMPNSIAGLDGNDDYGGIGGSIDESICPLVDSLAGLGGCGGNMPNGNCANSSSTPIGKNGSKVGGGGGGGAVKDNAAYTGGKGANGMVVIEWSN